MSVDTNQPMREAEQALIKEVNVTIPGNIAKTKSDLQANITNVSNSLQANITAEYSRASNAENTLTALYGELVAKFPVKTTDIGDTQVTLAKLDSDIQELLKFCETLPAFEFGYSEAVTIPAADTVSVDITFDKVFTETPQVFTEVMCNTLSNILVSHVTYVDTAKATIKLYNGGTTAVSNVTVDYLALAGR